MEDIWTWYAEEIATLRRFKDDRAIELKDAFDAAIAFSEQAGQGKGPEAREDYPVKIARLNDGAADAGWGCDEVVARNQLLLGPVLPQYRGLYFTTKSESLEREA